MINQFKGEYFWLSNFFLAKIYYDGINFPTNEHFFQAMKTNNRLERIIISNAPKPGIAKRMCSRYGYNGFKINLRADWDNIKDDVMLYGLRIKFSVPEISVRLIKTYPERIVEGNWWHDNYWGDCYCGKRPECKLPGKNVLGHLLEIVRLELINKRK